MYCIGVYLLMRRKLIWLVSAVNECSLNNRLVVQTLKRNFDLISKKHIVILATFSYIMLVFYMQFYRI